MTWNHRVIRHIYGSEESFAIHEVFYDDEGAPTLVTEDAVGVWGDTVADVEKTLRWMMKALQEPVLDMIDFEPGGRYYTETEEIWDE